MNKREHLEIAKKWERSVFVAPRRRPDADSCTASVAKVKKKKSEREKSESERRLSARVDHPVLTHQSIQMKGVGSTPAG